MERPAEPRETEREKVTGADLDPVTKQNGSSLLKVVIAAPANDCYLPNCTVRASVLELPLRVRNPKFRLRQYRGVGYSELRRTGAMADDDNEPVSIPAAREPPPRALTTLSPLVRRLVAPNPSPFTFNGACTYIVGRGAVAIVDPGPDDDSHLKAILDAVEGETVEAILITHTHRDHSPGATKLRAATGARVIGAAPFTPAGDGTEGLELRP